MARLALFGALCVIGCAKPRPEPVSLSSGAATSPNPSPVVATMQQLMAVPTEPSLAIPSVVTDAIQSYHIPTPEDLAADGRRYSLHLDPSSDLAWITVSGGIADHIRETFGPWPASNDEVQLLVGHLSGES